MGATPAKLAERYWDYAAQCLVIAQRQDNACDKVALTEMAQAWIALAEQAQGGGVGMAVSEQTSIYVRFRGASVGTAD